MPTPDHYQILGVPPDANAKAIKAAYRKMALQYHPDTQTDQSSDERMKQINEAYRVLSDAKKRAAYDRKRKRVIFRLDLYQLFSRLIRRVARS